MVALWGTVLFQSTPSTQRETRLPSAQSSRRRSFQSTPSTQRETRLEIKSRPSQAAFQSTPSTQRETLLCMVPSSSLSYFNPLPLRRGRPYIAPLGLRLNNFNPLPLRRGRLVSRHVLQRPGEFQSTPSTQRETKDAGAYETPRAISIHSLYAEGDLFADGLDAVFHISIHSLYAEGDASRSRGSR